MEPTDCNFAHQLIITELCQWNFTLNVKEGKWMCTVCTLHSCALCTVCTVGADLRDEREIGKLLSSHFEICRLPPYLPISQMISQMFITLSFGPVYAGCLEQQRNRYHLKPRRAARAVSSEDPANFLPYLAVQMVSVSAHLECFELPSFYTVQKQ